MNKINVIPALSDNYIWCITSSNNKDVLILDPGKAQPVIKYLSARNLSLIGICITHHHADHIDGVPELVEKYKCPVYGPEMTNPGIITHKLQHNTTLHINELDLSFKVLSTPGHTLDHIVYITRITENYVLFSGDTLFSSGCGRVLEGSYDQMYRSLLTLKSLPDSTLVYCAHEYTLDNLEFALMLEPNNQKLKAYHKKIKQLCGRGTPTVPTTIEDELQYNPFFRCHQNEIIMAVAQQAGSMPQTEVDVFTVIRKWKNRF